MSAGDYAYINAKIGALRSRMLTQSEMRSLIEVASVEDMLALLKSTHVGRDIAKLQDASILRVEGMLLSALAREYERIVKGLRREPRAVMDRLYKKFGGEVVKAILRLKHAGADAEVIRRALPLFTTRDLPEDRVQKMIEAQDVRELVETLKGTDYYKPLSKALPGYAEGAPVAVLTSALDNFLYQNLWGAVSALSTRDRAVARDLIGKEIDLRNVLTAFRLRGSDVSAAEAYFIPVSYRVRREVLTAILGLRHLGQMATELPNFGYAPLLSSLLKEYDALGRELPFDMHYAPASAEAAREYEGIASVLPLEIALRRHMVGLYQGAFRGDRFHIGVPMAHLFLRENEIRNIITALKLKEAGVEAEKIERMMVF
ncbi:MAG: V-type ATPase subunit [Euryarchaeota archaeon]|nr:V-type ATPase subunit [Euryarchaeota archaeon]